MFVGRFQFFFTRTYLLLLLTFLIHASVLAQSVGNYSVTRTTGETYNSIISTGNSFASWRYSGAFSEDDNRSEATSIGFDFWYNGTRYTEFSVSTNGFLDFSSSTDDGGPQCDDYGYCNFRFTSSSVNLATWLALAPFYDDMTTRQGTDPLGTSIKYQVSGTAPNRVLTVEWDQMAVYLNTTPDINFQVKIYETTGVIEYVYGVMQAGTHNFSYTVGINALSVSNPPLVSELLTQQTANSTTFNNTPQNNLTTLPASNSKISFTPPSPAPASGALTFTGVTNTGMTLNWTDWASNEIGYAIYSSTDGTNYFFNSQVAANSTSAAISGLLPSTNYFWRVYAVTEGALSTALEGNQTTLAPGTVTSIRTGRWDNTNTWDCGCIPTAGDNVVIQDTHRVTLRSTGVCNDLTIGQGVSGILRLGRNNATTYNLTVNGDIQINSGGQFITRTNSNTTHQVTLRGDLVNNGTVEMQIDANSNATITFSKVDGNQTVSGAGAINSYYQIEIDKNLVTNELDVASTNFTCDPDALSFISGGTFKFSSSGSNNFSLFNSVKDIPLNGRIWMVSPGSTMNFGSSVNLRGTLTIESGIVNIGDASNENLISAGGVVEITGGSLNVAGRIDRTDTEATTNFTISGGTLTLPVVGSTSTTRAPFGLDVVGSTFNFRGGTIILERAGGSNLGYVNTGSTIGVIDGGVLQIGNGVTPASQTIQIETSVDIPALTVNSTNVTGFLVSNDINVLSNVNLTSGVLNANNLDINLQGDWVNTGGSFTPGTGSVTFDGAVDQNITSNGSPFNNMILSGSGIKSILDVLDINGDLTINSELGTGSGQNINLAGNWINNGTFNQGTGILTLDGGGDQNLDGTSTTQYNDLVVNKSAGNVLVETNHELLGTLDLQSNTTFDADGSGAGVFTFVSNAVNESRLDVVPSGASIAGSVTAERYLPNASVLRIWRYIGPTVSGATVADLKLNLPVTGTFLDPSTQAEWPGIPGIVENSPSLYRYDETRGGTFNNRYESYPLDGTNSASASLDVGSGYAMFVRRTDPQTITLRGGALTGNVVVPVTSSGGASEDGWNLVSNPYLSQIDWDNVNIPAGINDEIHFLDNGNNAGTGAGSYVRYVGGVGTPASYDGVISKGQAFWIRATSNANLTFEESNKTSNAAQFFRESEPVNIFRISLTAPNGYDEIAIRFFEEATDGYDSKFDAGQQKANVVLSSLLEDNTKMGINTLPGLTCDKDIKLDISGVKSGEHEFKFFGLDKFYIPTELYLRDEFTETTQKITDNSVYTFNVTGDNASKGSERFSIVFEPYTDLTPSINGPSAVCTDQTALVIISETQTNVIYQPKINGEKFEVAKNGTGYAVSFEIPDSVLVEGENFIEIIAERGACSTETLTESLIISKSSIPSILNVSGGSVCSEGEILLTAESDNPDARYNWYHTIDSEDPIEGVDGPVYITPLLTETSLFYVSAISESGCEGERVEVMAKVIPEMEAPEVIIEGQNLISSSNDGNQWYLDDQPIVGAVNDTLAIELSGKYYTEVTREGCSSISNTITFLVTGIEEQLKELGISVYPNPFENEINIRLTDDSKDVKAVLMDLQGKVQGTLSTVNNSSQIQAPNLSQGVYLLRLTIDNQPLVFPIIKK